MTFSLHPHPRGFTLLEALVAVSLFVVIITALAGVIISFYRLFSTEQATVDVSYSAHAIMRAVTEAAAQASNVTATHTFSGQAYTSDASAVIFQLPSIDASGNVLGTYDYIGIVASGTDAYALTDAASGSARTTGSHQLSDVLSSLVFSYDTTDPSAASVVTAAVQTSMTVRQKTISETLNQSAYLKNKP